MRITNNRLVLTVLQNLNRNINELEKLQDHLSSGKRIHNPSDDPIGLAQSLALRTGINANEQYTTNIDTHLSWLGLGDRALNSSVDIMQRVRELAVQGATDTETAESRKAIANEINELYKQLLQIANTNQGGTYLFAGHETRTQPFVENTDTDGLQSVKYLGDGGERLGEIGVNSTVAMNLAGDATFMIMVKHSMTGATEINDSEQPLANLNLTPPPTAGTFTITQGDKTTTINVDPTVDSLEDVVDRLNASGASIQASIIKTNGGTPYKLKIESSIKGDAGRIVITNQTSDLMRSLGMATSLNPTLNPATSLSELNSGRGVSAGSFQITDRSGNVYGPVTILATDSIASVTLKVSAATGGVVTATLSPTRDRFVLTDTSTPPAIQPRNLQVTELAGGRTAQDLGILFDVPANTFTGEKVFHLAASTNLAALNAGAGVSFQEIRIENNDQLATVDLSTDYDGNGVLEVNDLIQAINNAGIDVKARVNLTGDRLEIYSTIPGGRLRFLQSLPPGQTLDDLGLRVEEVQPKDVFQTLIDLRDSLNNNNREAISHSLTEIDQSLDHLLAKNSEIGARVNRLEFTQTRLTDSTLNLKTRLSKIEDVDIAETIMQLKMQENVYQSSLSSGARIILPTLMDFLG